MEIIGAVKLKVAIGHQGKGGCIVECTELPDDKAQTDVDEYGSELHDFYYEGSKPPQEAGLYLFDGKATGFPEGDKMYRYEGDFKRIDI